MGKCVVILGDEELVYHTPDARYVSTQTVLVPVIHCTPTAALMDSSPTLISPCFYDFFWIGPVVHRPLDHLVHRSITRLHPHCHRRHRCLLHRHRLRREHDMDLGYVHHQTPISMGGKR